ncbi:O-acetyl-ADP-ribose deacetylase [Terasakiella sp. A23]|uniref:O-acetyl-ADP-ribose deacetylase n=1 Tax=Terasakiella sp. FCG-A23 TaxID=3080561 RepID=UPI0029531F11|nr:O-acetyl-ADP-ribose deacetylase [Terasakiella sp. A23]MDV7339854.1 O-acetyl-ADP-ribose deacetylase [Terasakiella sp. A23]
MATLRVLKGDITTLDVDIIVNAANASLLGGGGVDGAIHRAAGPALLDYCRTLGGCKTGEAKLTPGFNLKARHIAHTVGPIWTQHSPDEADQLLLNCYFNCLRVCFKKKLQVIAFPNISTGIYGFPKERAAKLIVGNVADFTKNEPSIKEIIFCCFDIENKSLYETKLDRIS